MELFEAIEKRRTVRSFRQAVSDQQLRKLLLAGVKAPSGSNVQPWEFIIVDDPAIIEQIAAHKYRQTLKMALDNMFLNDPSTVEKVFDPNDRISISSRGALRQQDAYQRCSVVAVCNRKGHGFQCAYFPEATVRRLRTPRSPLRRLPLVVVHEGAGIRTEFVVA